MKKDDRVKGVLVALSTVRIAVSVVAIPLAPLLWKKHFVVLVLMRPTKEVLLAGGFLLRLHKIGWIPVVAAAIPLAIFGVWQAYLLGRFHATQIRSGRMPGWLKRVIRPDLVRRMQRLLDRKGMRIVILGRLAAFPSAAVGAAAGAGDVDAKTFLLADSIGAVLAIGEAVGAGYLLGDAYKRAGGWITAGAVAALVVVAFIVARYLRREEPKRRTSRSRRKKGRTRSTRAAASRS